MLTTLKNAMKVKEIRQRVFFTFVMLIVIRIGSCLPVPGVDRTYFARWFAEQTAGTFNFLDQITGGSFMQMSILALNINPYITSSIIIQLLTIAIPKLEEMQREGETGRKKMVAITSQPFYKLPYQDGRQKYTYVVTALNRLQNESKIVKKKVKL